MRRAASTHYSRRFDSAASCYIPQSHLIILGICRDVVLRRHVIITGRWTVLRPERQSERCEDEKSITSPYRCERQPLMIQLWAAAAVIANEWHLAWHLRGQAAPCTLFKSPSITFSLSVAWRASVSSPRSRGGRAQTQTQKMKPEIPLWLQVWSAVQTGLQPHRKHMRDDDEGKKKLMDGSL